VEKEAVPGEVYRGSIPVTNHTAEPQEAIAYQTDYRFYCDGTNHFDDPGTSERSNAGWITFVPKRLQIPPGRTAEIRFEVRVPEEAALDGTYWSMLMVEEVQPPDPESRQGVGPRRRPLHQVVRYGVQCVTHIQGPGSDALRLLQTRLVPGADGSAELLLDVENEGARWAAPTPWAEVFDHDGALVGRYTAEKKRLFPGTSVRFRMALGALASGEYQVLVVLDDGGPEVLGATYRLEL